MALNTYTGFRRRGRIGSRGSQGRGYNKGIEVLLSKIGRLAYRIQPLGTSGRYGEYKGSYSEVREV